MIASINKECDNVAANFRKVHEFITHLISDLEFQGKILKDHFKSYLIEMKNLITGYGNNQNKIGIEKKSYKKIDKMYYKLIQVLQAVPKLISEDHNYLMSLGSGLCYFSRKIKNIKRQIDTANSANTIDKYRILEHLKTQLKFALFKYNKLATDYNKEIKRIDMMKSYLAQGIIMYSSNISKKQYAFYIDVEVKKFINDVERDKVSQIKNHMTKTLLKRLAQNMRNLSANSVPLMPLMSLDELQLPPEQPTNAESLY